MKFNVKYLVIFLTLLIIEVIIALFVHDQIIRPFVGDILVVLLMYTFIRGVVGKTIKFLALYLFLFAFVVEMAQYFQLVEILNLQDNKLMSTVIGTTYDIKDVVCYLIAAVILLGWERIEKRKSA